MSRLVNKSIKKSKTEKLLQLANKAVEEADRKHKQKEAEILRLQALELEKIKEIRALQLAEQQVKMKKEKEEKNEVDKVVEFELKDKSPLEEEGDKEPIPHEIIEEPDEKIILLTQKKITKKEGRELEKHYKNIVKYDSKTHKSIAGLDYEVLIMNVNNKKGREAWAINVKHACEDDNVSIVYLAKTGRKVNIPEIKKTYHAEYVRKHLPVKCDNKYLYYLEIFSDHISKVSSSCMPFLRVFLEQS